MGRAVVGSLADEMIQGCGNSLGRLVEGARFDTGGPEGVMDSPEGVVDNPEGGMDSPEGGANPEGVVDSPEGVMDSPEEGVESPEGDAGGIQ